MAGMWQIPFRFGWSTFRRLLSLLNDMEGTMGKIPHEDNDNTNSNNNANKEYIMLQRMVVVPQLQGQGVGSRALRSILSSESSNPTAGGSSRSTTSAWPRIYLDTQEESNVRFYEKLGWAVTSSRDFFPEDVDYKFHSWQMVHSGGNTSRCE